MGVSVIRILRLNEYVSSTAFGRLGHCHGSLSMVHNEIPYIGLQLRGSSSCILGRLIMWLRHLTLYDRTSRSVPESRVLHLPSIDW
jgi:hypothetical protein